MPNPLPQTIPIERSAGRYRQAKAILLLAVALLLGWRGVLAVWPMRAEFGESNYQQNLLRIENYRRQLRQSPGGPPMAVLAGTSVAGRMLPEYFAGTGLAGIPNLGLDGTSPAFALELLLRERQVPRRVFLETYLLHKEAGGNEKLIRESLDSPGGRLAAVDPLFRTETRPSSLLYSALKRGRDASAPGRPADNRVPYWTNAPAAGAMKRLEAAIRSLRDRGSEVVLVDLPVGYDWPPGPNLGEPVASELIATQKLTRLDLRADLLARGIEPHFTDRLHLDGATARAVAGVLADRAARLSSNPPP